MFSIIIPLYNKATFIGKAIHSVLAQTFREFELIIIDDGSTDDSLKNLQFTIYNLQLAEEKIRVIEQANQGVSTARNNGVKLAKYNYIAFLDADDWWGPTYLEEMKALIEEIPEAGLFASSYYKVKQGELIPARIGVNKGFEKGIINYFDAYSRSLYQPVWTGAAIIRRTVFESEKGFKASLKMGEDFDLWVRVANKHQVALLNKSLAYYNQDVDVDNRAIGEKLYEPDQHMLFGDYSNLRSNPDFVRMFETLAVYGLLPYYLAGKNNEEVKAILKTIHWENHPFKYRLFYRILPKWLVSCWMKGMKTGAVIKKLIVGRR